MNLRSLASFTVFISILVFFIGYLASLGIRVGAPGNRINVSMDVSDISNIVVGSNVLLAGIPVGKVSRIDTSINNATIGFYIERQYRVPVDSDVRLENLSALGEAYIELAPRSSGGPVLQDGQHIAAEAVKRPASISELGTSVAHFLQQLDPGQLKSVIGEVDAGLPDPDSVLPNLSRASVLLLNTTKDLNGRGQEMLGNLQLLLENAGWVGPTIAAAAPSLGAIGTGINTMFNDAFEIVLRSKPPDYIVDFSRFVQRIQGLLDTRGADIRLLTDPLLANVRAIAAAVSSVDTGQVLANLLETVPPDGAIELHVSPQG